MIEVGGGIKASPEGDKPSVRMWGRGPSRLPGLWVALAVAFVCTGLSIVMLQRLLVARGHASLSPAQAAQKLDEPYAHFFHKTVLIVNVNYEAVAEKTTAFWRKYYSRFFRHIVILCKRPLPHIGVEGKGRNGRILGWYLQDEGSLQRSEICRNMGAAGPASSQRERGLVPSCNCRALLFSLPVTLSVPVCHCLPLCFYTRSLSVQPRRHKL